MKKIIVLFFSIIFIFSHANSATKVSITRGKIRAIPIALNSFSGNGAETENLGKMITSVIENDLVNSGLFRSINQDAFIEVVKDSYITPNFSSWRLINADAVAAGNISKDFNGAIKVEYKLWNPYREKQISIKSYTASEHNWRSLAHKVADDIYMNLTGESGYFNTKIAFISETGPFYKRIKRLSLMDQDGKNIKYITSGKHLVLTPRFSPDASMLMYLSYANRKPKVFLMDLTTRKEKLLGNYPGMTFAPRFSPDGREAVLSIAKNGNSDIYIVNLETLEKKRLTKGLYIDTTPYFSPDGKKVVFSSDRSGRTHIYTMDRDGANQKRISFGEGSYNTPTWSPRGDYIAFTKIYKRQFHIGVMRPDGSGERILTAGYMVEGPNWSPNGRALVFTRGEENQPRTMGSSKLYTIDITGNFEGEISTPTDASDPAWSPLLK